MGIELDQASLQKAFQSRPDIQNAIAAASQGKVHISQPCKKNKYIRKGNNAPTTMEELIFLIS